MSTVVIGHLVLGVIKFGQVKTDYDPDVLRRRLMDGTAPQVLFRPVDDLMKLAESTSVEEFCAAVLGRRYVPAKPTSSVPVPVPAERLSDADEPSSSSPEERSTRRRRSNASAPSEGSPRSRRPFTNSCKYIA